MAIKRYTPKPSTFLFDGVLVGLRMPDINQMKEITQRRSAYVASMRVAAIEENLNPTNGVIPIEGDPSLLSDVTKFVAQQLCCDPENTATSWFAENADEQKQLLSKGIEKDTVEDVPASMLDLAMRVFGLSAQAGRPIDFAAIQTKAEAEKDKSEKTDGPLTTVADTTESTTTLSSASSALPLASTSGSTPSEPSDSGITQS